MGEQYQLDKDAHEEFLFHGTNDVAAESITKGDFLVNLAGSNAGTLYGKGVYLAESVSKSDEYTMENRSGERCILVCRAALGYVYYTDEASQGGCLGTEVYARTLSLCARRSGEVPWY